MNREEIKRIKELQLISIDNVIFEPIPKNKNQSEKDTIYLNELGRTIERTCYFFVLLSFIGLLSALFFGKFL
jgi:hypothetical protein|tara:strand:- start:9 stop:224 length:216 start_codon:yes stop_codon:yes gene_type:complete